MKLSKVKINFVVDAGILLGFLGSLVTGIVLWVVLPSGGYQGGRGVVDAARVFILGRETWRLLHNWLSLSMAAGVVLHQVLHWKWLDAMVRKVWRDAFSSAPSSVPQLQEN